MSGKRDDRQGDQEAARRRVAALARLLDDSIPIPGTSYRIGLDALIGLIPGVGDFLGGLLSTYIVIQAIDQGVARATVLRMALNVLIETVVGAVPVLGDLFDAAWKANVRNARLLETALAAGGPRRAGTRDLVFLVAVVTGLLAVLALCMAGGLWLLAMLRDYLVSL